jgi:hypothetical protein
VVHCPLLLGTQMFSFQSLSSRSFPESSWKSQDFCSHIQDVLYSSTLLPQLFSLSWKGSYLFFIRKLAHVF